jgi:hypothetical protein
LQFTVFGTMGVSRRSNGGRRFCISGDKEKMADRPAESGQTPEMAESFSATNSVPKCGQSWQYRFDCEGQNEKLDHWRDEKDKSSAFIGFGYLGDVLHHISRVNLP